jgi:hypothetical protein
MDPVVELEGAHAVVRPSAEHFEERFELIRKFGLPGFLGELSEQSAFLLAEGVRQSVDLMAKDRVGWILPILCQV